MGSCTAYTDPCFFQPAPCCALLVCGVGLITACTCCLLSPGGNDVGVKLQHPPIKQPCLQYEMSTADHRRSASCGAICVAQCTGLLMFIDSFTAYLVALSVCKLAIDLVELVR